MGKLCLCNIYNYGKYCTDYCVSHLHPLGVTTVIEDGVEAKVKPWIATMFNNHQCSDISTAKHSADLLLSVAVFVKRQMLFNQRLGRVFLMNVVESGNADLVKSQGS